jgi:hypothetical protein
MIDKGIIKSDQVVFVYSQPPEAALIGFVDRVSYPFVYVSVVPRSGEKNKFGRHQKLDISKNIALTILTEDSIKEYMTPKEKKCLNDYRKESEIIDLFAGEDE